MVLRDDAKFRPIDSGPLSLLAMSATERHISFACPHCGQAGEVVWRDDGAERELVRLSSGFHVEEGRLAGARHVIVCNACDEIDPPRIVG